MARNHEIIEAMIHAALDKPELIDELSLMAEEAENLEPGEDGVDMTPIDQDARDRLAAWIRMKSRGALN